MPNLTSSVGTFNMWASTLAKMWGENTHIEECKSKSLVRLITAYAPWDEIMIQILDKVFTFVLKNFLLSGNYNSSYKISLLNSASRYIP